MFSTKKMIITGVILSVIVGTTVFANEIAQVTGLQDVEVSQNDSIQPTNEQEVNDGVDEGKVTSEPIENPSVGAEVTISEDGVAAKTTGLENALQHVKNENARAQIQANIEKKKAKDEAKAEKKQQKEDVKSEKKQDKSSEQ